MAGSIDDPPHHLHPDARATDDEPSARLPLVEVGVEYPDARDGIRIERYIRHRARRTRKILDDILVLWTRLEKAGPPTGQRPSAFVEEVPRKRIAVGAGAAHGYDVRGYARVLRSRVVSGRREVNDARKCEDGVKLRLIWKLESTPTVADFAAAGLGYQDSGDEF